MSYIITGYDHYGRGITKDNNKIIFVDNALIGEKVEINIYNNKKWIYSIYKRLYKCNWIILSFDICSNSSILYIFI